MSSGPGLRLPEAITIEMCGHRLAVSRARANPFREPGICSSLNSSTMHSCSRSSMCVGKVAGFCLKGPKPGISQDIRCMHTDHAVVIDNEG